MEVTKTPPVSRKTEASPQTGNATIARAADGISGDSQLQKDFQVQLDDSINNKLADLANLLQHREKILQALPEDIRKRIQELLQQLSAAEDMPQGLDYVLKAQKNIAEQLYNLGNALEVAVVLQQEPYSQLRNILRQVAEFLREQGISPGQLADQLLLLVKEGVTVAQNRLKQAVEQFLQQFSQLPAGSENTEELLLQLKQLPAGQDVSPENLKQIARQIMEQFMPDNLEQLVETEKASIDWFVKVLDIPLPLTPQQAEKSGIPHVLEMWSALKAADTWRFTGTAPGVLEQAADRLEPFCQELTESPETSSSLALKLNSLAQELPSLLGRAVEELIKQGMPEQSLPDLVATWREAAAENNKLPEELKALMAQVREAAAGKPLAAPAADVLIQIAGYVSDTESTVQQAKALIRQVKQQMSLAQESLPEEIQSGSEQLIKTVGQMIPQPLQEMAARNKLPELSRLWVLLKAAEAEQWQENDGETLQKSAGTVKELAHSLYKSIAGDTERQPDHKILSFSLPLYFADGTSYPTHIHIYHQKKEGNSPLEKRQFETWMRVSVEAQNIGIVDSVFRLYDESKLDLRVLFPEAMAIQEFKETLPQIRKSIENTTLTLASIMINKV